MRKIIIAVLKSIGFWAVLIVITTIVLFIHTTVYSTAYYKGLNKGYNIALDTVNCILKQQSRSDTNHCSYVIIDTSYYILEHKKCK